MTLYIAGANDELCTFPQKYPVSAKMSIKEGARAIFINAPADAIAAIELLTLDLDTTLTGDFDYIHLFANSQKEFHENSQG